MTKKTWRELLKHLDVNTSLGEVTPAGPDQLRAFEQTCGVRLPRSYRAYCEVFGAGELAGRFQLAVPGYRGMAELYSLDRLNALAHDGLEYDEYSKNPEQHKRGIFFGTNIIGSFHFFDPDDIADRTRHEYAVFTLSRDWKLRRSADSFWAFITECCLGRKYRRLIKGARPEQVFTPMPV